MGQSLAFPAGTRPEAYPAATPPDLLRAETKGGNVGCFSLPGVTGSQPIEGISKIVVHATARGGEHLVEVRQEHAGSQGVIARKTKKGPFLPDMHRFAGFLFVVAGCF